MFYYPKREIHRYRFTIKRNDGLIKPIFIDVAYNGFYLKAINGAVNTCYINLN